MIRIFLSSTRRSIGEYIASPIVNSCTEYGTKANGKSIMQGDKERKSIKQGRNAFIDKKVPVIHSQVYRGISCTGRGYRSKREIDKTGWHKARTVRKSKHLFPKQIMMTIRRMCLLRTPKRL